MHIHDNEGSVFIVPPCKGTNHWLYLVEAELKPQHLENQTMT